MRSMFTLLSGAIVFVSSIVMADTATTPPTSETRATTVQIIRTEDGVPHVRAGDWRSLGYGYGYVQAQDNLCTLAEAFVTYRGERSRYFGPDGTQATHSTLGEASNIDSDFFFRLVDDDAVVQAYRSSQTPSVQALIAGYTEGYNRYVDSLRTGDEPRAHAQCRGESWVATLSEADVYRRLYAANLAGGFAHFIPGIANAAPPSQQTPPPHARLEDQTGLLADNAATELLLVGGKTGIGSNGIAFGAGATHTGEGLLFGNPHWYWAGPDRFYQAQLTIPGVMDVAGVSFLGVPVIMLGFNDRVAWTHTVSTARRFGIFELKLVPGHPTQYLFDGKPVAMTPVPIEVAARQADGTLATVARTLYRTRFGPVVSLTDYSPRLGWSAATAFALRDVNAHNFRIFQNFLEWGQARSLDQFIAIQEKYVAMPWVNTLAIGQGDGRAWYADIGAVPGVPDTLAQACTTAAGKQFAQAAPGVPFLDGSRSECEWRTDAGAAQPGALAAAAQPRLLRQDYVANMNNSFRLANPAAPLTGYAAVMADSDRPLGLRPRLGYELIQAQVKAAATPSGVGVTPAWLKTMSLDSASMSARLFMPDLLEAVCGSHVVSVAEDPVTATKYPNPRAVYIDGACKVLRQWDGTASVHARGAYLWDEVWKRLSRIPPADLYRHPYSPDDPLHTPAGLRQGTAAAAQALGAAVLGIEASGHAIDAERADVLYVARSGKRIGLFGGCDGPGYFTSACAAWARPPNAAITPKDLLGNTYMQVVDFSGGGPNAYTLLSHGESDDDAAPDSTAATERYARKDWLRFRYTEDEIAADPARKTVSLTVPAVVAAAGGAGDLAARWRDYKVAHPDDNARDASKNLGVTEAALVGTELGKDVVLLKRSRGDLEELVGNATQWGEVTAVTRNEYGISERTAVLEPAHMQFAFENWAYVFSVIHYYGAQHTPIRSLQAFDRCGNSITKIILAPGGGPQDAANAAFDAATARFRAAQQLMREPAQEVVSCQGGVPAPGAMPRQSAEARTRAAQPVSPQALQAFFQRLVRDRQRVGVVVSNRGLAQDYAGVFDKAAAIGDGWYSLQAKDFVLHLHLPDVTGMRLEQATGPGSGRSGSKALLDLVDRDGNVAVRLLDDNGQAFSASPAWQAALASLESKNIH